MKESKTRYRFTISSASIPFHVIGKTYEEIIQICLAGVFTELSQMNFENTICVEAPPFDYGPDYSLAAWTTLHGEMCALAEGNP